MPSFPHRSMEALLALGTKLQDPKVLVAQAETGMLPSNSTISQNQAIY